MPDRGSEGRRRRCCATLLARADEAERLGMRRVARALVCSAAAIDVDGDGDRALACRVAAAMLRHRVALVDLEG